MAALLKKRALAEYSQAQSSSSTSGIKNAASTSNQMTTGSTTITISAEEPKPPKIRKLKIIKKSKSYKSQQIHVQRSVLETELESLDSTRSSTENFRALSRIAACLPSNAKNETLLRKKVLTLFSSAKDAALRAKCLTILQLLNLNQSETLVLVDDIIELLAKETSNVVLINGISVIKNLGSRIPISTVSSRLVILARKFIKTSDSRIKCKCLEILGAFALQDESKCNIIETMQFVHSYSHSNDPRVRSTTLKMIIQLHEKGAPLDVSIYPEVVRYLDDDYEIVKLAAIQLLATLSQTYPERMTPTRFGEEKIRLVDDAFAKICTAINDPFVQVRVMAAQLLGKMPQVSQTFLDQTLDKKLMSDMRRKRSAHERQWEKVKKGEWSSGKKWADDAPKEILDADSISLISSGAAGAFVHGLEDEFMEVRAAAIDSLCTLAIKSPDFANLALDFLVDMFNDEIEEVRIKAIDSLTKMSEHIELWSDQLDIILAVLEDSSIDIREGLHKLLSVCKLMTKDCVQLCLEHLLENLKKYPQDKKSIWKCLEGVGRNHPWTILPLVPQLLSQHPFFDTSEPDPEDPAYVSVLILVLNGVKGCPTMKSLFDEKITKHYHYLRDTLPHLVPDLSELFTESVNGSSVSTISIDPIELKRTTTENGRVFMKQLIAKLTNSSSLNADMQYNLGKLVLSDLKRLAEVDKDVSAIAKFTALYIRAKLIHTNCLGSTAWTQLLTSSAIPTTQNQTLKHQIESFLQLCLKMQYKFNGLSKEEFSIVIQLKLRALALQLAYIVRGSNASALAACQNLLEQAETVQKYLEENNCEPNGFTQALFEILDSLDDPKPGTLVKLLVPLFEKFAIPFVPFSSSVKMTTAAIIEPTGESDNPLKFTAGLLLGIQLDCELQNLVDPANIRIRVKYPDQQVHLICPRLSNFRTASEEETRLLTTINVSHQAWTEACPISLTIVMDLSGPETNYNHKLVGKNDPIYTIQLSDEKHVLILPKAPRRGI